MQEELNNFLVNELSQRKTKNSNYSLRAFARDLEISPAYLSLLLNKKVELSEAKFKHIVKKVFNNEHEANIWIEQFSDSSNRFFYKGKIPEYKKLHAEIKMTWAHYAILEAFNLKNFEPEFTWFESVLGIGLDKIEQLISELIAVGAIFDDGGILKAKDLSLTNIRNKNTSEDRKQMQRDFLIKSLESIESIDISKRDHTSMTIAIDSKKLDKIKDRIQRFRRELCCEISSESSEADAVYQLQFSVFPLNKEVSK